MYSDNLDHTFLQLMIESEADAAPLGLINWFSVHPTSMPRTNQGGDSIAKKLLENLLEKLPENPLEFPLHCTVKRDLFSAAIPILIQLVKNSA